MNKINIKNLSRKELVEELKKLREKEYRAKQIFHWLYGVGVKSFDEMTDLSLETRKMLKTNFHITHVVVLDSKRSSLDGTAKYLYKLEDGNTIETVFLPFDRRNTLCVSSQIGCKYACSLCASAPFGFIRNLMVSEILDEVIFSRSMNPDRTISNIVFMGIGEPFDNYDNVLKAIRILNDKEAFNIGARKITLSTCGVIPGIEKLKSEKLQIELSVSLHSPFDRIRSGLIPLNKRYSVKKLIDSCRDYIMKTDRVITFEYVLIKALNCGAEDAHALAELLNGLKCKVNVIAYNRIVAKDYKAPSPDEVDSFIKILCSRGINVTLRQSKGEDIDAGCGQLRISRL